MATSKLQRYTSRRLSDYLGKYTIRENYRPDWLNTDSGGYLELDFFIEELNLAIEVQGRQHWIFIPYFHGDKENFYDQLQRDKRKKRICQQRGIRFVEIFYEDEVDYLISGFIEPVELTEDDKKALSIFHEEKRHRNIEYCKKLEKDLLKVDKSIDKWHKLIDICKSSMEIEKMRLKLYYATNRRKNMIGEINAIKRAFG